jgi:hypothetical protein
MGLQRPQTGETLGVMQRGAGPWSTFSDVDNLFANRMSNVLRWRPVFAPATVGEVAARQSDGVLKFSTPAAEKRFGVGPSKFCDRFASGLLRRVFVAGTVIRGHLRLAPSLL